MRGLVRRVSRSPSAAEFPATRGRNIFNGPGFFNLDASITKLITFREHYKLEIRGESFGVTNTPQFSNPGVSITSPSTFGYITGAGGGRTLQLGAKFDF